MLRTACALLFVIYLLCHCSPGLSCQPSHHRRRHHHPPSPHPPPGGSHPKPPSPWNQHPPPGSSHPTPPSPWNQHPPPGGSHPKPPSTTYNVYYHYHYIPPPQIHYAPRGGPAYTYPVYHSQPPTYVYLYRDSSSKYGQLLAGLSLYNLGMRTTPTFSRHRHRHYQSQPGEVCKLGIRKENGDYEETKIDCEMISSFIWADEDRRKTPAANLSHNSASSAVTMTVINTTTTTINDSSILNDVPATSYTMLPNGTLVQVNDTQPNGSVTSSVTTVTTTNTMVVTNALDPKNNGPPVEVTDGTLCYVMRRTRTSNMKHKFPCGLLQSYASQSLRNAAAQNVPVVGVFTAIMVAFIVH
ncbi:hypothetical protein EVAR_7809_1 [Eumeta japonica]|uniref:Uncharacterized protein n=1 Tax=Eumeta variegata TaxID=151549 RepID=A0A4C1TJ52_EUMVA|nr:hypothetical protein EVAR_7809_1 [Eumeta japonica]